MTDGVAGDRTMAGSEEPRARLGRIVRSVCRILGVPIAAVALVEGERFRIVASEGCPFDEVPRHGSLPGCTLDAGRLGVIADLARADPPIPAPEIDGRPVRFYAGVPIRGPEGDLVGVLCSADFAPRTLDEPAIAQLEDLAAVAADQLLLAREFAEHRRLLDVVRDREQRFRDFAEVASDWFWETDAELRFTWLSDTVSVRLGVRPEWHYGKTRLEIAADEEALAVARRVQELMLRREPFADVEYLRRGPTGDHWLRISGKPVFDAAGRFVGYRGTGRDVTQLRKEEAARREAEERYRVLVELSPDPVVLVEDGRIVFTNQPAARILGVDEPGKLVGRSVYEFVAPEHRALVRARQASLLRPGDTLPPVELSLLRTDGARAEIEAKGSLVVHEGRRLLLGVLRDIGARKAAERALREAEERYRTLVELSPTGILLYADGAYRFANRAAARILGADDPRDLLGVDPLTLIDEADRERIRRRTARLLERGGANQPIRIGMRRLDGRPATTETAGAALRLDGRPGILIAIRDVTDEVRARAELAAAEARWRSLVELSPDAVVVIRDGVCAFANKRAIELFGAECAEQLLGRAPREFFVEEFVPTIEERGRRLLEQGGRVPPLEAKLRRMDGTVIDVETTGAAIRDGETRAILSILRDISERKRLEAELRRLAYCDPLTGLPNRALFFDRLEMAVRQSERDGRQGAVLLLDLDGFKQINDNFGHDAGDALLVGVARRLKRVVRRSDTVARLAGDEFALILYPIVDEAAVERVAERILSAFAKPVRYRDRALRARLSLGGALFPVEGTIEALLKQADIALYRAKSAGRNRLALADRSLQNEYEESQRLGRELAEAVEQGAIELACEPRVDLGSGRTVAVAISPIWNHPRLGSLVGRAVGRLAEAYSLAGKLAELLLTRLFEASRGSGPLASSPIGLVVEVPCELVCDDRIDWLAEQLRQRALPPERLQLEIAEPAISAPAGKALRGALDRLRGLGVRLALHEFGTGSCALRPLAERWVDGVTIAAALLADWEEEPPLLLRALLELAGTLDLPVTACGIERPDQRERLAGLGCRYGQGPLWSPPRPLEAMADWLRRAEPPPCACSLSDAPITPR